MEHFIFVNGVWSPADAQAQIAADAVQWLDFTQDENQWFVTVENLFGLQVHENHIADSLNRQHPPKFEASKDYELLIMPSLIEATDEALEFSAYTMLFNETLLITIRPPQCLQHAGIVDRLERRKGKAPNSITGLLLGILNTLVDAQMNTRARFATKVEGWQESLVENENRLDDWQAFFFVQRRFNHLIGLCEMQWDALEEWRSETDMSLTAHQQIRLTDVLEHLQRLSNHIKQLRSDIDNLLQIYFSLTQEKTNEIVRLLTVISVVFLPLNLMAGIFGMNFSSTPLINSGFGFWITLFSMTAIAIGIIAVLRRLRWL
ncbi:MAG: magnesium transporter CorA family protein [Gammaproteobacteria bacterium]|nr:magnesium transporter CorA family protein [Gammaproteobacteria bacterium]